MTTSYARSSYIPVTEITKKNLKYQYLDMFTAKYLDIKTEVTQYTEYTVPSKHEGAADAISKAFYGTEDLWWIICLYNNIIFPLIDLYVGSVVRIPNLDQINFFLSKVNSSSRQGTFVTL